MVQGGRDAARDHRAGDRLGGGDEELVGGVSVRGRELGRVGGEVGPGGARGSM